MWWTHVINFREEFEQQKSDAVEREGLATARWVTNTCTTVSVYIVIKFIKYIIWKSFSQEYIIATLTACPGYLSAT